jgi:hypothetical protein
VNVRQLPVGDHALSGAGITGVDAAGRNFIADLGEGDLWSFPAGITTRSGACARAASFCSCSTITEHRKRKAFLIR